jgi:pilus assembly protein TadC
MESEKLKKIQKKVEPFLSARRLGVLDRKKRKNKKLIIIVLIGLVVSTISLLLGKGVIFSIIALILFLAFFILYFYFKVRLAKSTRIRKMESVFPDFLQLMSSNLRAGMTIDKAMLLSVRKEFSPLDKEIEKTGRDIATGQKVELALLDMSKRISSEKINKTILLILSGIKAGGNVATLLEQTSANMRERGFVEKRAASNVLMYVIFIFLAVSVGAPLLFSLSTLLVETLTSLLSGIPTTEATGLPFTLSTANISITFVKYFSIVFIIFTDVLASLVLGLVSKGEEKQGLRFLLPLLLISLSIFFAVRFFLADFIGGLVG